MGKHANRVDTSLRRDGLTSNPFAILASHQKGDGSPEAPRSPEPEGLAFRVMRTRKGGWPLRVEKRAAGKVVTVVSNIDGEARLLLTALRKHCGSGGVARPGLVEIQGDHRARIEEFLNDL